MKTASPASKQEFFTTLLADWKRKLTPLRMPVYPQTLVKDGGDSRTEFAFLLSEDPESQHPFLLRLKYTDGRIESSRDELVVEHGDWKSVPDIESARVEMDTFIADFECGRR